MGTDLKDLIETPRETLDVEFKQWVNLGDKEVRANIARHLAALANYGGGHLVFGFKDDLTVDQERPSSLKNYNRDTFTAIVRRYLTPAFQCDVFIEKNEDGEEFPIIKVPSHGREPIAAKADGPKNQKGKISGIRAGTYYIRKPGPESAPIIGAEEWGQLIRRCTLNDRDRLLSDISSLVQSPRRLKPEGSESMEQWHIESRERFLNLLSDANDFQWSIPLEGNHYHLSYIISLEAGDLQIAESLHQVLEEVSNKVRETVWTGWSMFYPFRGGENAPTFHPERLDGTGAEVLEANLLSGGDFRTFLPDFWRVSPNGRATLIRAYREDRERNIVDLGRAAGTWISPETIIRETTELVRHASFFAQRFETATKVTFCCSWNGLKGRELADFDPSIYWRPGQIAKANHRTIEGVWSTAQLAGDWSIIVAELGCPILRLFGFANCSPEFVKGLAPRFKKF